MTHVDVEQTGFPLLAPRDIVTSSATLLGLLLTAFGAMIGLSQGQSIQIVRNFAFVFIGAVLLFVLSVALTCLLTFSRRYFLWRAAILSHVMGWAFLGTVLVLILLGYAYGIEFLQPQLPQFAPSFINWIALSMSVVAPLIAFSLSAMYFRRRLEKLERDLEGRMSTSEMERASETEKQLLSEKAGLGMALAGLRMAMERELRRIGAEVHVDTRGVPIHRSLELLQAKNVLDSRLVEAIRFVYRECSAAIHGMPVEAETAHRVLDLGATLLVTLRKIATK